jgi:cell division protein FtsN
LAKTEVVVDAEPLPVKLPQPYYIQAGSFGKKEVALKEQARLKRFGFDTQLSAQQGQKRIYYRLRLGPFSDRLQMNKVRNQLRNVGVDTLLIKAPKPKTTELASQTEKGSPSIEDTGN